MSFFDPQNPGIDGLDEITAAEAALLNDLSLINFQEGDLIVWHLGHLVALPVGSNGDVLGVSGGFPTYGPGGSGSGTVTSVSVASANGFAGTVANPTTTPAITISTTVTGMLKGNGTAISAALAGTDYVAPGVITSDGITMNTNRILGRTTAGVGAVQEISIGAGLSLSAGTLSATGGGGTVTGTGTDNHIVRWDGTGVPVIQDSGIFLSDADRMTWTDSGTSGFIDIQTLTSFWIGSTGRPILIQPTDTNTPGGGQVVISAGGAVSGNTNGHSATLSAGTSSGSGTAGGLGLSGGTGGNTGNGGLTSVRGGSGGVTSGNGGNLELSGGDGTGGGTDGLIKLKTKYTATLGAFLDISLISSTSKTFTFPNATGTIVLNDNTATLTNKRITPRVVLMADATSFTATGDTADVNYQLNTQAVGTLTANAPSGTPTDGQVLKIRIKSTNIQTFSWNAIFRGSNDLALPTVTTGSGKTDYMGFMYNSVDSKWDLVAATFGF